MIIVTPSALMTVIMKDMGIGYSEAGMMVYITTIVMGIFLFVGSSSISRMGAIRTLIIAMVFLTLDGVLSYVSHNYLLVLFGRVLSGVGNGLSIGACSSLIAAWFDKKHHGIANSISSITYSVSVAVAYAIIVPIYELAGSWQNEMVLWSGLSILCCVALLIWGRGKADKTVVVKVTGIDQAQTSSLRCAMKYREVWYLAIAMTGFMWAIKCLISYLPSYLSQSYGLPIARASSVTGIFSLAGILGSMAAGLIYPTVRSKKMLLLVPIIVALVVSLGIPVLLPGILLYSCIFLFGFSHMSWSTVSSTLLMDLEGVTPGILSGLMAIMLGLGTFFTVFAPFLFDKLIGIVGMQKTMLLFASVLVVSLISMLLYKASRPSDKDRIPSNIDNTYL